MASSCHVLHLVGKVSTGCRRWKRFAIFMVESDSFFNDLAKVIKHRLFVETMATAIDKAGRTADIALVFLRPLNDLCVARAFLHGFVVECVSSPIKSNEQRLFSDWHILRPLHDLDRLEDGILGALR